MMPDGDIEAVRKRIMAETIEKARAADTTQSVADDCIPPEFSEEALALRFTERHRHELRYVAAWGRWLIWDGAVWQYDNTMRTFDFARAICRQAASECNKPKIAAIIASAKTVAAVERLARADRAHAATIDQWDVDPWLLNTPDGIVHLRTGATRQHRPDDYSTKITAIAPGGDCPNWLAFLKRITGEDGELQAYLKRFIGYCLTGLTSEHALGFAHGTGANGKSTLVNTVSGIMNTYATTTSMDTFTASYADQHPTNLAALRGARLVTAQETEAGRRWAEARIKALTGGDKIAARFMRQDFFEFTPVFKLWIAGNHKPGLRNVDEAIRRRLHLQPFTIQIPADERDPDLMDKLRAEWPGVLKWAIEGCLEWQQTRLSPPPAVVLATENYMADEDTIGRWIADCCVTGPECRTDMMGQAMIELQADLFASWKAWAEAGNEMPISNKRFSMTLQARGFEPGRKTADPNKGKAGFYNIQLRAQQ